MHKYEKFPPPPPLVSDTQISVKGKYVISSSHKFLFMFASVLMLMKHFNNENAARQKNNVAIYCIKHNN
jgi:hypothetical protein